MVERAGVRGLMPWADVSPARRALVVLVASVVLGVVVLHAMNGSTHHRAPGQAAVVAVAPAAAGQALVLLPGSGAVQIGPAHGACHDGCGADTMLTAICLIVLVAVVGANRPPRRALPWDTSRFAVGAHAVPGAARFAPSAQPSLIALGINRT